jgi:hypothetical protein
LLNDEEKATTRKFSVCIKMFTIVLGVDFNIAMAMKKEEVGRKTNCLL